MILFTKNKSENRLWGLGISISHLTFFSFLIIYLEYVSGTQKLPNKEMFIIINNILNILHILRILFIQRPELMASMSIYCMEV